MMSDCCNKDEKKVIVKTATLVNTSDTVISSPPCPKPAPSPSLISCVTKAPKPKNPCATQKDTCSSKSPYIEQEMPKPEPRKACRILAAFIPDWLKRITSRSRKGRLVVEEDGALHHFGAESSGPINYDSENDEVFIGAPENLEALASESLWTENGYLPLWDAVEEVNYARDGFPCELKMRLKTQEIRDVETGGLVTLDVNCATGKARFDRLAPEEIDLHTATACQGERRRISYSEELVVDEAGCSSMEKKWYASRGEAYNEVEVPLTTEAGVFPFFQQRTCDDGSVEYVLSTPSSETEIATISSENSDDFFIPVLQRVTSDTGRQVFVTRLVAPPASMIT